MIRTFDKAGSARWPLAAALLALVLLPSLVGAQSVEDKYRAQRERNSLFNLAAGPSTVLQVNQYQCGLVNTGDTCTDVFDSPTGGGGFWPTGSPNQYMFNSGLQVVGIIPESANFAWAGDTTGAFFMDASGLRQHGTPITDIYNSLNADDLESWPTKGSIPDFPFLDGIVDDTALFADVLIGRKTVSQQDTWVAYWDGDPGKTGGREHPMGIVVEQRSMAWSYPSGNEASIFFIYRFTNVTNNPRFQQLNEAKYGIQLPDAGWRFDSIYVAFDTDPDVGPTATNNYATAVLPFDLGMAYIAQFYEPSFIYPAALFHPPFFTGAPGISGFKYLRSPVDPATGEQVGLTSFSQHTNGGAFPDPNTVQRGWRYLSLNVDAGKGDPSCSFDRDEVRARKSCYLAQTQSDVRVFIGSGPFSLQPGQSSTVAVMMFAAATVNTPGITASPTADNKPGVPSNAPGCNGEPIRPIDRAAGYISPKAGRCPPAGEKISQFDVNVVPESLLGKALVAQSVFDNKFLLGFAPETPTFYLVPGDNQVTVVWEPSKTDVNGDPFFAAAGNPTSPLYDPNYRRFDVEGYRVYRGTSPANLRLLAQFDKKGTVLKDVLCMTDPTHITGAACTDTVEVDIKSPFVQYTVVQELASGDGLPTAADTALAPLVRAGGSLELTNSGIPYAYIDRTAKNGFTYYYKVTAFDINSVRSGPTSLESAAPAKSVMPVSNSAAVSAADYSTGLFGRTLRPGWELAGTSIQAATGMFNGPQPPSNGLTGSFQAFASQLLPTGTYRVRVDSVKPDYYGGLYFFTATGAGGVEYELAHAPDGPDELEMPVVTIASNAAARQQLVADLIATGMSEEDAKKYAPPLAGSLVTRADWEAMQWHSGDSDWAYSQPGFWSDDPPNTLNGGSRWFSGTNETTPNPTVGVGTAGTLPGITKIFVPNPYQGIPAHSGVSSDLLRRWYQSSWALKRAADVKVYWGAAKVDSVVDVTHDLRLAATTGYRVGYGFFQDGDANGVLNWGDIRYIPSALVSYAAIPNIGITTGQKPLVDQPVVLPVDVTGDNAGDGNGFAMFINGEMYFFQGAVPSNTQWTLRTYSGAVTGSAGSYAFQPRRRPPVPGTSFQVTVNAPAQIVAANADLTQVHAVPDPYYANSLFDRGPATKELKFVNLPPKATVRIYSMTGVLVDVVNHDDPTGGGMAAWNLRNRSNQFVASGVYFFHVSTPDGKEHIGKFTLVNSGFAR